MTCRHSDFDPECGSYKDNLKRLKKDYEEQFGGEKDASQFTIDSYDVHGDYLILTVTYPSCKNCSFEGTKLMVFKDVTLLQVMQWRKIDPHFREGTPLSKYEAPGPVARFPATDMGKHAAQTFVSAMASIPR